MPRGAFRRRVVRQRYLSEGTDGAIAARVRNSASGTQEALGLLTDYQGTTLEAIKLDGTEETNSTLLARDAFGKLEANGGVTAGSAEVGTGFAGGSTPNSTGGFTYFRNRWYDPNTGRFLSQDPIGLGGGINLYAYAGNAPTMFSDPFGLWDPPAHKKLLVHALANLATANQIAALNWASERQDLFHNWDNKRHFLADKGMTPEAATTRSEAWIASETKLAREAHLAGDDDAALSHLGAAMHTLMDETSPAHVGPNGPNVYPGPGHSMCDHCGGKERSQDITPAIQAREDKLLSNAYNQVFGPSK